MKLYRTKDTNEKLYPVCNWENNQHKIGYWYTKARNDYDMELNDETEARYNDACEMMEAFDHYVINGIVYAPYQMYKRLKEAIICYDVRH